MVCTVAVGLAVTAPRALAQEAPSLALEEAVDLFVANSVELDLARSRLMSRLGDARQRRAIANPTASFTNEALGTYSGEIWLDGTTTANSAENHPEMYGVGINELGLALNQNRPPVIAAVRGYRIGDTLISAHPGELFNELGSQIKDGLPENRPWIASYCDGYIGYISTRLPHEAIVDIPVTEIVNMKKYRRYYGTTTSPYSPDAGEALVVSAVDVLKTL